MIQADLSKENGAFDLYNETYKVLGFPDTIINNAGIAVSAPLNQENKLWLNNFDKTISFSFARIFEFCNLITIFNSVGFK